MKYIVEKEWLLKNLDDTNIRVVDCRFSLGNPDQGENEYEQAHLPGAVFFDLEKDLSGTPDLHGGRHPLPDLQEFIGKLERAGIDGKTTLIAYDSGAGAFAARFWWMMQYLGHDSCFVLNGGYREWADAHFPISKETPLYKETTFQTNIRPEWIATYEEVKRAVEEKKEAVQLLDSREEKRYLGIEEPIDIKAGHIPGAINKQWFDGLENGLYKPIEIQQERFSDLDSSKPIIVYCGSGVTAAPNFLALKEAGFGKVKLYIGSFSDWISYQENEID